MFLFLQKKVLFKKTVLAGLVLVLLASMVFISCNSSTPSPSNVNAQIPVISLSGGIWNQFGSSEDFELKADAFISDGGTLTYEWFEGETSLGPAESNDSFILDHSIYNTIGTHFFSVKVTNEIEDNGDGGNKIVSATSNAVIVTVCNFELDNDLVGAWLADYGDSYIISPTGFFTYSGGAVNAPIVYILKKSTENSIIYMVDDCYYGTCYNSLEPGVSMIMGDAWEEIGGGDYEQVSGPLLESVIDSFSNNDYLTIHAPEYYYVEHSQLIGTWASLWDSYTIGIKQITYASANTIAEVVTFSPTAGVIIYENEGIFFGTYYKELIPGVSIKMGDAWEETGSGEYGYEQVSAETLSEAESVFTEVNEPVYMSYYGTYDFR